MYARELHKRGVKLCDKLTNYIERGFGDEPCREELFASFNDLAEQAFHRTGVDRFTFDPACGVRKVSYREVLVKAEQLRVVIGSRAAAQPEPDKARAMTVLAGPFLSTFSAAALVFVAAAHFASVVPPTVRLMISN